MSIVYTIIQSKGFHTFELAGKACDAHCEATGYEFNYRPYYVSKGIVVGVYNGSRLVGYLG